MILALLTLLSGLALSGTAAYYSIIGLVALFPGAVAAVIAMGSALEVSKLVGVSWLYRNWKIAPYYVRGYMMVAIFTIMFITSMGVFGFLSKAHIEHTTLKGADVEYRIESLDASIASKQRTINRIEKQIGVIDDALDKYIELGSVTKGIDARKALAGDQKKLELERIAAEEELVNLQSERAKATVAEKSREADIGPLKYIAELVYGEDNAAENMDKAVRWVILLIVFVFDPFAIILLIAANVSLMNRNQSISTVYESKPEPTSNDVLVNDIPIAPKTVDSGSKDDYNMDGYSYTIEVPDDDSNNIKHTDTSEGQEPIQYTPTMWLPSVLREHYHDKPVQNIDEGNRK